MPNTSILSQDSPNASNAKLRNQISTLQTELASIRIEKGKFSTENSELSSKISDLKRKKAEWQDKLKSKMTQLSMAQVRMKSMEDELFQVVSRENRQAARLKKLEHLEKNKQLLEQLQKIESGDGDENNYCDKLIAAGDYTQVKRFSDQVQRAYQEKCNETRKMEREIDNLKRDAARQSRIIRNHEDHVTTIEIKLKMAEKNLELSREKAKLIHRAQGDSNCSIYSRLVAESPLSDDIVAQARARFRTPDDSFRKPGQKRKSSDMTPSDSKSMKFDNSDHSPALFGRAEDTPGDTSGQNSTWDDNTLFENVYFNQISTNNQLKGSNTGELNETPVMPAKKKPPNERLKSLAQRIDLSSDSEPESVSPVIGRKPQSRTKDNVEKNNPLVEPESDDDEMPFRLKRIRVKPRNPNKKGSSPVKPFENSSLDVSRLVKESALFNKNTTRYPNGLGGSSKFQKPVTKKLQPKNRKPNIADFFKNSKLK